MPPTPSRTGSLEPTRRQLDDLDALLQRMLALPVEGPTTDATAAPALPSVPRPPVTKTHPEPPRIRPAAPRLAEGDGWTVFAPPAPPRPVAPPPQPTTIPRPSAPPPPAWLLPAVAMNSAFDRTVGRLGAPGRWFLRPAGRNVLGFSGLALLVAALALVAHDWFGWTW